VPTKDSQPSSTSPEDSQPSVTLPEDSQPSSTPTKSALLDIRAELRGTYRLNEDVIAAAKSLSSSERSQEFITNLERQNEILRTKCPNMLRDIDGEDSDVDTEGEGEKDGQNRGK
jgi:hypothetical protein